MLVLFEAVNHPRISTKKVTTKQNSTMLLIHQELRVLTVSKYI